VNVCLTETVSRLPGSNRGWASQPTRLFGMAIRPVPIWTTPVLARLEKADPGFGILRGDCTCSRSNSRMNHASLSVVMEIRRPVPTPAGVTGEQCTALKAVGQTMHLLSIVETKSCLADRRGRNRGETPHNIGFLATATQYIGDSKIIARPVF
jgi:hypothetical protein